jgi:hypothetical protein
MRWGSRRSDRQSFLTEISGVESVYPKRTSPCHFCPDIGSSSTVPAASSTSVLPHFAPITCKLPENMGLSDFLNKKLHFGGPEHSQQSMSMWPILEGL